MQVSEVAVLCRGRQPALMTAVLARARVKLKGPELQGAITKLGQRPAGKVADCHDRHIITMADGSSIRLPAGT